MRTSSEPTLPRSCIMQRREIVAVDFLMEVRAALGGSLDHLFWSSVVALCIPSTEYVCLNGSVNDPQLTMISSISI